jgi:hypothetical protein
MMAPRRAELLRCAWNDGRVARSSTKNATSGDMIRSLAVIIVPLLVITFFFSRNLGDHPVKVVDYQPILAQARAEAPYPVLAPVNLPSSWRPTQAFWVQTGKLAADGQPSPRNSWTLGFLDPSDTYISIYQGDAETEDMVSSASRQGVPDGSSTVGGQTWQRLLSLDGRTRSLVLVAPKVTSAVVGDVDYEALEAYVSTLRSS